MLVELKVKDFGIIEDIDWRLDTGLSVITGETGAGKSLVIDAVELLLFGASSEDIIRSGASEARVEGVFILSDDPRYASIRNFLEEKGLTQNENTLVVACEVRKLKPVMVRINGHTVTKTILRQLGQLLIDIHGQSEHLSLLDKKYHLYFLDAYAHTNENRIEFGNQLSQYQALEFEIKALKDKEQDNIRQEEFLKYQIEEIDKAGLQDGEDEDLEQEKRLISFSARLKEYSNSIYQALYVGDRPDSSTSAMVRLNEALRTMKKLVELDPRLGQNLDSLEKAVYGIEEVARDTRAYGDNLENDPRRMEEIESRLELIRNLKRKYGKSIPDILSYRESVAKDLSGITSSAEKREHLEREQVELKKSLGQLASNLSIARAQAAQQLTRNVKKELHDLDMSQMQFEVYISQMPSADGIVGADGTNYSYNSDGIDDVEFRVSTNPGEPLKPLAKIASTGEISRFTLALKGALSEADNIPVLIFDEIDIGIGGRSGDIIGKKLWALARNHQVVCVTHLPQIAAYADAHYGVQKQVAENHTSSILMRLLDKPRIKELAVMLAGPGYSDTALKSAQELMQKAETWKILNPQYNEPLLPFGLYL